MTVPATADQLMVRPSSPDDVTAITKIYAPAVLAGSSSFEVDPPDVAEMARRRAAILADAYPFLVAERGGVVLGYAYAGPYRARPAYRLTAENSVYVADTAQGFGVGTALLRALLLQLSAGPWREVVAIIGDSANLASRRLHERHGFRLVGVLTNVGFKHDRFLDSVIMQKSLKEEDAS